MGRTYVDGAQGPSPTIRDGLCVFMRAVVLGAIACFARLYVPFIRIVAIGYIEFCRAALIFV